MTPELTGQIACAAVIAWGAFSAVRAHRSTTRTALLGKFFSAVTMLLFVRLIADFGGWSSWFIYLWLICLGGYVIAGFLAARVWPDLPWRAESTKARRSEMTSLGVSGVLTLVVSGALVVPGLMLS